eukprot:6210371-Pleurochrysis_carterae.AAC.2
MRVHARVSQPPLALPRLRSALETSRVSARPFLRECARPLSHRPAVAGLLAVYDLRAILSAAAVALTVAGAALFAQGAASAPRQALAPHPLSPTTLRVFRDCMHAPPLSCDSRFSSFPCVALSPQPGQENGRESAAFVPLLYEASSCSAHLLAGSPTPTMQQRACATGLCSCVPPRPHAQLLFWHVSLLNASEAGSARPDAPA